MTSCTFSGNLAYYEGGGMDNYNSRLTVTNCTFSGNSSRWNGGGMHNYDYYGQSSHTLTNCILWGNTAPTGPQIYNGNTISTTVTYSDVQGGKAECYDPCDSIEWGTGNIDIDPCFVDAGYWDANGTPDDMNDDFWIDGDYHLKSEGWRWDTQRKLWTWDEVTSRCIDAGNPGSPIGEEPLSVPDDPSNEWGMNQRINMGAFGGTAEASIPPYGWALLADITNDGTVDFVDMKYFLENWLNAESKCPADFNRDDFIDMLDYAIFAEDWLLETVWY